MEAERDLPPWNMCGPQYRPSSPVYGRGAGIPRLARGMGCNDPYMMDRGHRHGHGMGGMRMEMEMGMGMGRMGGGFGGMGGMGHSRHHGKMGGRGGFGSGGGGLIGLAAHFLEDKMSNKSSTDTSYYDGGNNFGYSGRGVSSRGSDSKAFKKVCASNPLEMGSRIAKLMGWK